MKQREHQIMLQKIQQKKMINKFEAISAIN